MSGRQRQPAGSPMHASPSTSPKQSSPYNYADAVAHASGSPSRSPPVQQSKQQTPQPAEASPRFASAQTPRARSPSPDFIGKQIYVKDPNNKLVLCPDAATMRQGGTDICWPIRAGLFLGGALAAADKGQMQALGITHILNLVGDGIYDLEWMGGKAASYFPNSFKYLTIQTADQEDQDLKSLFQRTSAFIESGVRAGGVLVHCFAGVSRSATCVAAYLMDRHEMTAQDALSLIQSSRKEAQPNPGFLRQLQDYEAYLQNKRKSFFNARPAGGKKTKKDMQQNTPRSMQDARAATNMTAQNMRKSSSGAKAYQEGETALQTFLKRKIFSNKDSSSPPAYASPPHRTATAVMPAPRTATAVSSSPLSSSRPTGAGALIRRPEVGNDRKVPMSTSHIQNAYVESAYFKTPCMIEPAGNMNGTQKSFIQQVKADFSNAFGAGRSVGGGSLIYSGGDGGGGVIPRSAPSLIRR